jgi:DNA-binding NarL/FixJ family response regulator
MTDTQRAVFVEPAAWPSLTDWVAAQGYELHQRTGASRIPVYRMTTRTDAIATAENLTNRQLQVLLGFSQGMSNRQIGQLYDISEHTIKTHSLGLFRKLHAHDRAHAVAIGYQRHILGGAL